jgi:pilus assembly protein Flp/PilA
MVTELVCTNATLTGVTQQSRIDITWLNPPHTSPSYKNSIPGELDMNHLFLKLYIKAQNLAKNEEGQDLVEYALLVSLIALSCITGMKGVATFLINTYSNISTSIG